MVSILGFAGQKAKSRVFQRKERKYKMKENRYLQFLD
jgi:hypothetical protein